MRRLSQLCLLVAFICAGLAILGAAPMGRTAAESEPPLTVQTIKTKPIPRVTALDVCTTAMCRAYKWDHGAQLIFVTSRPVDFGLDGRSSRWGFRCVSGDGAHVAGFSVDMAHLASPVRVAKNINRPPTCLDEVNRSAWKIDSPEVWKIARRNGLDSWLAKHPSFDMSYSGNRFELAASKRNEPYWLVSCSAKATTGTRKRDRIVFKISAVNGRLLSGVSETSSQEDSGDR